MYVFTIVCFALVIESLLLIFLSFFSFDFLFRTKKVRACDVTFARAHYITKPQLFAEEVELTTEKSLIRRSSGAKV